LTADNRWRVESLDGQSFVASSCILTPPLPQALDILAASDLPSLPPLRNIHDVSYDPCVTVLAICEHPPDMPENGVLELSEGPVLRIMDNHRKGISPDAHALTIHADADFSRRHFDTDTKESGAELLEAALRHIDARVHTWQAHRWRYSVVHDPLSVPFETVLNRPLLLLAGDAFGANGVEGAARSGLRAAHAVRDYFSGRMP
jgi:predicted NAD/FAD-dependent oxidoreductase